MSVESIEAEIEKLSPEDFARIRDWVMEREADEWDRQIERDAIAGKFDRLAEKALEEDREGKSIEL
jgi:hypothetical protein